MWTSHLPKSPSRTFPVLTKTAITCGLLVLSTLASQAAQAHHGKRWVDTRVSHPGQHQNHHAEHRRYREYREHRDYRKLLRLDLPVDVHGRERVKLKRLINRYYNVNLDHYNLRRVVINNHNHRGQANLRVGQYQTRPVGLHPGRNHIHAPTARSSGRWQLDLRHVSTDNIRVVLEPKHRLKHRYLTRYNKRHHWYAYH